MLWGGSWFAQLGFHKGGMLGRLRFATHSRLVLLQQDVNSTHVFVLNVEVHERLCS